jgi:hypothetical protein
VKNRLSIGGFELVLHCIAMGLIGCSGQPSPNVAGAAGAAVVDATGGALGMNSGGTTAAGGQATEGGTSSGGTLLATGGDGSISGTGGAVSSGKTCSHPTHVLPLNPSNPQDGVTLSGFYVATDTWNAANYKVSQTLSICDYDNWYVVANMNDDSGDGAVKTYPNVHKDFGNAPAIQSLSTISTSFAHTAPHVGIYEFAYDIWLNGVASNGSTEVMIWTDNYKQTPSGSQVETFTLDGQSYRVYKAGSYIAFVVETNVTSGTVNLLSIFQHIITKGWIGANSTLGQIDYGVELVSTGGADATFEVNGFSLTAN